MLTNDVISFEQPGPEILEGLDFWDCFGRENQQNSVDRNISQKLLQYW